jgi:hypothetical protein
VTRKSSVGQGTSRVLHHVTSWSFSRLWHVSIVFNISLFRKSLLFRVYNFVINQYWGQFNQISYQFECKYSTFYVNVMRFSGVTCYFLQVKSENLYISDVRKIILHVVSMWDMEILTRGYNCLIPHRYNIKDYFTHITNINIFGFNLQKVIYDVGKAHNVNINSCIVTLKLIWNSFILTQILVYDNVINRK